MKRLLAAIFVLLALPAFSAQLTLADCFSDNMVLQRNVKCPIWGYAAPGAKVELSLEMLSSEDDGSIKVESLPPYRTVAGPDGKWRIDINPTREGGPWLISVKSESEGAKIENVMFGDVYLCSGQSNMEFRVRQAEHGEKLIADAGANRNLRLLQVKNAWSGAPQENIEGKWAVANPKDVAEFSAVAYVAGRKLADELGIPIGLVQADWGGTPIEAWTSKDEMEKDPKLYANAIAQMRYYDKSTPAYKAELERCAKQYETYAAELRKAARRGQAPAPVPAVPRVLFLPDNMAQPAVHFNAMINPLVPMAFKGVFWYQGSANVAGRTQRYDLMLEHLTADWRKRFNAPELPFVIVQLAPYNFYPEYHSPRDQFPTLVYFQQQFTERDPHAYLVVTNDVGNINDIHPTAKIPVGTRVADICLRHLYGKDVPAESPLYKDYEISGGRIAVRFANGGGLHTADGKAPDWFEIAGSDGVFYPADAVIENDRVILSSPHVAAPVAARFAWECVAVPNLRNAANLPAGTFRTPVPERGNLDKCVPGAAGFNVIYRYTPNAQTPMEKMYSVSYAVDNTAKFAGRKVKRVGYFAEGVLPDGSTRWVFAAMDPFTSDISRLGVPLGVPFQQKVANLEVASNVPGVACGKFPEGAIEFWHHNFDPKRKLNLPGASDQLYDWDDTYQPAAPNGHGSMQVHNISGDKPQVVFAYNKFAAGPDCEFGIGNNPDPQGQPDYVYSETGKTYKQINLIVLAEFEE